MNTEVFRREFLVSEGMEELHPWHNLSLIAYERFEEFGLDRRQHDFVFSYPDCRGASRNHYIADFCALVFFLAFYIQLCSDFAQLGQFA